MIHVKNTVLKKQHNFWNHCLFHPTDAVEDTWGRQILDKMAEDGSVRMVRLYTMFEDIVYLDEEGGLRYDFRVSDLRLDYMLEKGYDILLAYAGMPDCIAASTKVKTTVAKNKTRYKGKMWNTSPPRDYALWEEICYEYTKHNVERYGIETVARWHCHCFNEPDGSFFLAHLPREEYMPRLEAYCKLYAAFERGVRRVSDRIPIGGPATTSSGKCFDFVEGFLNYVRENGLKLDYVALHNYGTSPKGLNDGTAKICVENNLKKHRRFLEVIRKCGFEGVEVIVDEWGAASAGFYNMEECPDFIFRETEVYSAYFVKLIRGMIDLDPHVSKMMICLSGQHEMVTDFSGFRNFFTLNFIKKPIYNAYILASKLGENLLDVTCDRENVYVVPTENERGEEAVLLSYSDAHFSEEIPTVSEEIVFEKDIADKTVSVWCIDREHTNPYCLYQQLGIETPTAEELRILRREGTLKPILTQSGAEKLTLTLTPNSTYLITVTA